MKLKPTDEFYKQRATKDGLTTRCGECHNAQSKASRARTKAAKEKQKAAKGKAKL